MTFECSNKQVYVQDLSNYLAMITKYTEQVSVGKFDRTFENENYFHYKLKTNYSIFVWARIEYAR